MYELLNIWKKSPVYQRNCLFQVPLVLDSFTSFSHFRDGEISGNIQSSINICFYFFKRDHWSRTDKVAVCPGRYNTKDEQAEQVEVFNDQQFSANMYIVHTSRN